MVADRPGTRVTPEPGEEAISHLGHDDVWHIDEILADGTQREYGWFHRLDLALGMGHVIAHARAAQDARRIADGLPTSGVVALTVADGVYVIGDIIDGDDGYFTLPPDTPQADLREVAHQLVIVALVA